MLSPAPFFSVITPINILWCNIIYKKKLSVYVLPKMKLNPLTIISNHTHVKHVIILLIRPMQHVKCNLNKKHV